MNVICVFFICMKMEKIIHHQKLVQQVHSLDNVKSICIDDAIIGNEYLFCFHESHYHYYIGQLHQIIIKKSSITQQYIYWVQFRNVIQIDTIEIKEKIPFFYGHHKSDSYEFETNNPLKLKLFVLSLFLQKNVSNLT
jgi:hypothetical protein